jgi:hypothetical protein
LMNKKGVNLCLHVGVCHSTPHFHISGTLVIIQCTVGLLIKTDFRQCTSEGYTFVVHILTSHVYSCYFLKSTVYRDGSG